MASLELAKREQAIAVLPAEMTIEELVARTKKVTAAMQAVMKDGEHYGVIPGTKKPTLLKPGAEKLANLFMLDPEYETTETFDQDHLTVVSRCTLYHIPTGNRLGSGMGSCSTKESKYAYRIAARKCPSCGKEAIIRGKEEYGGGWLCFKKKDGCGAKFKDGDASIEEQESGRVANEDKADQYNTVLKMANKRSLVAAVLNVTAASDIFTQDLEDSPPEEPKRPAERMTPEQLSPQADANVLLGRIQAGFDLMRFTPEERQAIWKQACGEAAFMTDEADVAALATLYETLAARHKAAVKGKR
jgi:hypothetical protein